MLGNSVVYLYITRCAYVLVIRFGDLLIGLICGWRLGCSVYLLWVGSLLFVVCFGLLA